MGVMEYIQVTVVDASALPQQQASLRVMEGATVREALALCEFVKQVRPPLRVGVWGQHCELETVLQAGDRIEIYQPLLIDPKEARRIRAKIQAKKAAAKRRLLMANRGRAAPMMSSLPYNTRHFCHLTPY